MKQTNKNLVKVTLIVVAVVLAVSAVLVFLKTRVQPPIRLAYTNQYIENLHQASSRIADTDEQGLEQEFQSVINRMDLLKSENLLSEEEHASSFREFLNAYVPAFRNKCEQQFNQPAWPQESLQFMQKRIKEVRHYSTTIGNESMLTSENEGKLAEVEKVLTDYREAWALTRVSIRSSNDSRRNLAKARQYKQDAHLSKCTALVNAMNNLPSKYQKLHYAYVSSLVKRLSMSYFDEAAQIPEWAQKYKNSKAAIADYNSAASSLYHTSASDFNLDSYYLQAKEGFRNKISYWDPASIREPYEQTFGVRLY